MAGNNMISIGGSEILKQISIVSEKNIPIWRKNTEGKFVVIPIEKLAQYLGSNENIEVFIEENWNEIITKPTGNDKNIKIEDKEKEPDDATLNEKIKQVGEVENNIKKFKKMSIIEREELLDNGLEKISELKIQDKTLDFSSIIEMVEVVANTFYSQNACITDINESPNLKNNINGIIGKSQWIVKLVIEIFKKNINNLNFINEIEKIDTGSKTLDHINRVFLSFIAYMLFYNKFIDDGLFTKKIRTTFKDYYLRYYKKRLNFSNISIENIFKGGIQRIDEENKLPDYATGALLFDIGKVIDIEYHDQVGSADKLKTKKHVLAGYNMIINTKVYPPIAAFMAVFHHEYYGSKGSYNFTSPILTKLTGIKRDNESIQYLVTTNEREFINGQAQSYFPIKILEILDTFDAIKNKKNNTICDTLMIMKKELVAQNLKLDPVLFGIFLYFKKECGAINDAELQKIMDYIF